MSQTDPYSPVSEDKPERLLRHEARMQRRAARAGSGWIFGLVLIAVGVILFLRNQGIIVNFPLHNWWAVFILLPAIGAFTSAWSMYQEAGQLTNGARGSLFGGLILTVIAATFFFELNWSIIGPVLLLMAGAGILVNALLRK